MRVVRLCLLGLGVFLATLLVLFPAAPVIDRFLRPQLGPVALEGVSGPLLAGRVERVRSTDDLLPLELRDLHWSPAPLALVRGAGADLSFSAYGGEGEGRVLRAWNGDIVVDDLTLTAEAKALEPLLPVPIAAFSGSLAGDIASVVLENGLLRTLEGTLSWREALLERPVRTALGTVELRVEKGDGEMHVATVSATGGDVGVDGTVSVGAGGDYSADILMTPSASAPREVIEAIGRMARPEAGGRFRLQQSGNVNRLM